MPKTLLLADDSITIQKVVGIIFASEDYSVTTAADGEDALAKIRERRPDLVLADVVMPRKNGYELCEAVKNDPDLQGVPVLLLAGTFEAFDEARAKAVRADGWIQKPFESAALLSKVREIVEGIAPSEAPTLPWATSGQARPAVATVAPRPPAPPPAPPAPPTAPFAVPAAPFAQPPAPFAPPPPPAPFAVRPPVVPTPPAPPPPPAFAARPPMPPAPPAPPPPPAPTFRAPPPAPVRADFSSAPPEPRPSFSIPLPPPPPPAPRPVAKPVEAVEPEPIEARPAAPFATLEELDFTGATLDSLPDLSEPPPPMKAPPAPPPAPAIPSQRIAPVVEPEPELDFDIDEAAAPIDLADLAAEEITDDAELQPDELHAETRPLPTLDLTQDDEEPATLDLSSPWDEPAPRRAAAPPTQPPAAAAPPRDPFADLFADESRTPPALELSAPAEEPEPLDFSTPLDLEPAAEESTFRLDADPRPFRPFVDAPAFDSDEAAPSPFELEAAREHEPSFNAMPGFPPAEPAPELDAVPAAASQAPLAPPPPIAVAADEAVLREALARASQETIERVVWEVVPQLAENIIREHLERLVRDRKIS